jgi:hypothetical protein
MANMLTYNVAMEFLFRVPAAERMNIKLIYPKDKTTIPNQNNFVLLAAAAVVVARQESPYFKYTKFKNEYIEFDITEYLGFPHHLVF